MINFWKPWYVYRPIQIATRVMRSFSRPQPGYQWLKVAWGARLLVDPTKSIGRSIWTTGVFDIGVSEVLCRLIQPGDTVVDVGANIGYMTLLMAILTGEDGTVIAFEPHPELFEVLSKNAASIQSDRRSAAIRLRQSAAGNVAGSAQLIVPADFSANDGVARLSRESLSDDCVEVTTERLDDLFDRESLPIALLKVDVEGHELEVLRGAENLLTRRLIQHVVFESHDWEESESCMYLQSMGYALFEIGWNVFGPELAPAGAKRITKTYEAPNYLATLNPESVLARFRSSGWRVLKNSWSQPKRS